MIDEIIRKLMEPRFWLDILVLSLILYRILISIRQRLLFRILMGGFGLISLYLLAKWLQLSGLSWLMDNLYTHLVILLIVTFQPELRSLISEVSFANFPPIVRYFTSERSRNLAIVPELSGAVYEMSKQKIGSLITILGNDQASDIIRSGQSVRTPVTREFLQTIFQKKSLLHDGALIIDDGRIIAIACYLPMTESETVQKKYGARHRAALGMSEKTDALLIVTSEETGEITLIKKSMILRVNQKELQSELRRLLTSG